MKKSSIIEDLKNPAFLPDRTTHVDVVQTHISIVFVADCFVYKIKKPVNFGFLDFSSLEKRRHYCRREVELNRRLARDIYIDVLPIIFDGEKHTMTGGAGEAVEYAVKMRRIPDEKLMKSIFQRGALTAGHLKNLAEIIANFHSNALRTGEIDTFGEPEAFRVNTDENFSQVEKYIGVTIPPKHFDAIKRWTASFYKSSRRKFQDRIKAGRIRDCHGDLHMAHVCLDEGISIIDCIEFNDRFRYSDTVADIAFLIMDLEYHGGESFAKTIWTHYKAHANEDNVDSLLRFYKIYRAFVRGKVNSFQLDDANITRKVKAHVLRTATKYFQLAYSYL